MIRTVLALSIALCGACAPTVRPAPAATGPGLELLRAARANRTVRVYHGPDLDEGPILHLGGDRYRIRHAEIEAGDVDSVFVELAGSTQWKPIVAGAGVGGLLGLFIGEIWQAVHDARPEGGRWFVSGAIIGGVAGLAMHTTRSGHWEKRWPRHPAP